MKKILVVDDNESFSALMETMFSDNYEIHKARDGKEGVDMATEIRPDLILLDVMMPRMSGIEVLRRLQATPETESIPVVVLTAHNLGDGMERTLQREPNVASFMKKTAGVPMILGVVEQVLGGEKQ